MKKTLAFVALAALALVAGAAAAFPAVAAGVQSALAFVGPETLAGISLAGVAGVIVKDKGYTGQLPVNTQARGAEILEIGIPITFPSTAPIANDTHALCTLLPGMEVMDWALVVDDLDSNGTPTASLALGELTPNNLANMAVTYQSGITLPRTGGVLRYTSASEAANLNTIAGATKNAARVIGLKWETASATYTAGKTGLLVLKVLG